MSSASEKIWACAVTHYGERLRDTDIAVSLWSSRNSAFAAVRDAFADELEDFGETHPTERAEALADDDKLIEHLRWFCNVVVSVVELGVSA